MRNQNQDSVEGVVVGNKGKNVANESHKDFVWGLLVPMVRDDGILCSLRPFLIRDYLVLGNWFVL